MAAGIGALFLAILVAKVHSQTVEFYNPNIQYPGYQSKLGYQTPQQQLQWPQQVIQQASSVNVDDISLDVDINAVNLPYSQTVIQPSGGTPIVKQYPQQTSAPQSILQQQSVASWPTTYTPTFVPQGPLPTIQQVISTPTVSPQRPQGLFQQVSSVNVDDISVDVDINSINVPYSQTVIQPSVGTSIVKQYPQPTPAWPPTYTPKFVPQGPSPSIQQVISTPTVSPQRPQGVFQQVSSVNVDDISVDVDINSINVPYSQTVIQPSVGPSMVKQYPQPTAAWPPTYTPTFVPQVPSPTIQQVINSPTVSPQRPQGLYQQVSSVNVDDISVDVDINSINVPFSQTIIQPSTETPIFKQYQQPAVSSSYPSILQQQSVSQPSWPPSYSSISQTPQSTLQQINFNPSPVPFPRPQIQQPVNVQQASSVNVDDISIDVDINSVNLPYSQTIIGTPQTTISPLPNFQRLNLPSVSSPSPVVLPRPQIYSSPPIIEQVQPITISELPQPILVNSPVLTPTFAPTLIPTTTVVQTPTVPLVPTTVVDNSLSNSLANVLQLLLTSRLVDSQINPYSSNLAPLYNAISSIGTTSVYSPLVECNLIDNVYGYDTISPYAPVFGTVAVPELSPLVQYTQEYYTSPVLAEVLFPSYIPAQITCSFAPLVEPISAYEQIGIYF